MIDVRRVHKQFPTLVITVMEKDRKVLRPGEDSRAISEISVSAKGLDLIRIEVKPCSSDGFGQSSVLEGTNAKRESLMTRALIGSGAAQTGDTEEISSEVNAFLNEHIGAAGQEASQVAVQQ